MKKRIGLDHQGQYFSGQQLDRVVLLRFTGNFLIFPTLLEAKKELLDYLDVVSKSETTHVVLAVVDPERDQVKDYLDFYGRLSTSKLNEDAVWRMYRAYDQYILKTIQLNKLFVHSHAGQVVLQVLNVGLAGDYRIAADDTVYHNPSLEFGSVAKGGGGFFLKELLGHDKALQVLLSREGLTARDAQRLGLVDDVVPAAQWLEASVEIAKKLGQTPAGSISVSKKFLNYDVKRLAQYLEMENKELMMLVQKLRRRAAPR